MNVPLNLFFSHAVAHNINCRIYILYPTNLKISSKFNSVITVSVLIPTNHLKRDGDASCSYERTDIKEVKN